MWYKEHDLTFFLKLLHILWLYYGELNFFGTFLSHWDCFVLNIGSVSVIESRGGEGIYNWDFFVLNIGSVSVIESRGGEGIYNWEVEFVRYLLLGNRGTY